MSIADQCSVSLECLEDLILEENQKLFLLVHVLCAYTVEK